MLFQFFGNWAGLSGAGLSWGQPDLELRGELQISDLELRRELWSSDLEL